MCYAGLAKTLVFHRYGICPFSLLASCVWALHIPLSSISLLLFWNITSYFHRWVEKGIVRFCTMAIIVFVATHVSPIYCVQVHLLCSASWWAVWLRDLLQIATSWKAMVRTSLQKWIYLLGTCTGCRWQLLQLFLEDWFRCEIQKIIIKSSFFVPSAKRLLYINIAVCRWCLVWWSLVLWERICLNLWSGLIQQLQQPTLWWLNWNTSLECHQHGSVARCHWCMWVLSSFWFQFYVF